MNKKQKSELELELDKDYELLKQNHPEFFAKVENKRLGELSLDEWKYVVTHILPEIGEIAHKEKVSPAPPKLAEY